MVTQQDKRLETILESIPDAFFAVDREWRFTYLNRKAAEFTARMTQKPVQQLIGKNLWEEFPGTRDHPLYVDFRRAMDERVPVHFQAYFEPLKTWFEIHAHPSPEGLSIFYRDTSEVKEALRWSELLQTVASLANATLDAGEIIDKVLPMVVEGALADSAGMWLFDPGRRLLELTRVAGKWDEVSSGNGVLKLGEGVTGAAAQTLQPVISRDLAQDKRITRGRLVEAGFVSLSAFPMLFKGELIGVLTAACMPPDRMGGRAPTVLALIAGELAAAVKHARLFDETKRLAEERLKALEATEFERDRLETLVQACPLGIILREAATGLPVLANREAERLTGLKFRPEMTFEQFIGGVKALKSDGTRWNPQELPLNRALHDGQPTFAVEMQLRHPDGSVFRYLSSTVPVKDNQGRVIAAITILQDLAPIEERSRERTEAMRAIEREHERIRALVEASPTAVFVTDAATRKITLANKEFERVTGVAFQPGLALADYLRSMELLRADGTRYDTNELPTVRALQGEEVQAAEVLLKRPDGTQLHLLKNSAPVFDSQGHLFASVTVLQDLAPLQELENLRSEFLGMVSHELRTPVATIKGAASAVLGAKRPRDPGELRDLFAIVSEQADRLSDLVDDLLDMTRIEAGVLPLHAVPADLLALVKETQEAFRRRDSQHELALQIAADVPAVRADLVRLQQVLDNLLDNAAKFSPPGTRITLSMEHNDRWVTVRVSDQGWGISPEKLPTLFRKFSRAHKETGVRGTGLGLAISKGIVEAHGGRIWAESPGEGRGATFSFTFPVVSETSAAPQRPPPSSAHRGEHLGKAGRSDERARVLVLDDQPSDLMLIRRVLHDAGYRPIVTSQPAQVLDLVESEEPDLIVLDLLLPGTTGFNVLEQVRRASGAPVIFVTMRDSVKDSVRALEMGADDYITKPFSAPEFVARIEAILRRRVLPDTVEQKEPFVLGDLAIDFGARRVTVDGKEVRLTATEYKILYALATNTDKVLTHDQIAEKVWGREYVGYTVYLRSYFRDLRRKLGDDAKNPRFIETLRGAGYRMSSR